MKIYEKPDVEVIHYSPQDIIAGSPNDYVGDFTLPSGDNPSVIGDF